MYQVGDRVMYGAHGVCLIAGLETMEADGKTKTYLVLEPMGQEGCRYLVPVNNNAAISKLRHMLRADELESVIAESAANKGEWIRDENRRKQTYRELISSGNCLELMRMVRLLYRHKHGQSQAGKKVHMSDENFLKDAENLLASEVSVILEIPRDEAKKYLRNNLSEK